MTKKELNKALAADTGLTAKQKRQVVDAYHRRVLQGN